MKTPFTGEEVQTAAKVLNGMEREGMAPNTLHFIKYTKKYTIKYKQS